jgi:hypothetical protein
MNLKLTTVGGDNLWHSGGDSRCRNRIGHARYRYGDTHARGVCSVVVGGTWRALWRSWHVILPAGFPSVRLSGGRNDVA